MICHKTSHNHNNNNNKDLNSNLNKKKRETTLLILNRIQNKKHPLTLRDWSIQKIQKQQKQINKKKTKPSISLLSRKGHGKGTGTLRQQQCNLTQDAGGRRSTPNNQMLLGGSALYWATFPGGFGLLGVYNEIQIYFFFWEVQFWKNPKKLGSLFVFVKHFLRCYCEESGIIII